MHSCEMAPSFSRLWGSAQFGLAISDHVKPAEYCLTPLQDATHGRMLSNGSTSMKSKPVGTLGATAPATS